MQSYFDGYAAHYDSHFTHTPIGKMQRALVWQHLPLTQLKAQPVLEINCGTGEDALQLQRLGAIVTATDASAEMIATAKQKAGNLPIQWQVCPFSNLATQLQGQQYRFVLSNFGGLNCINGTELKDLAARLHQLVCPNGRMYLVIMGTGCWWEQLYFIAKGKWADAFRRKRSHGAPAQLPGRTMQTYYYSPAAVKQAFAPYFVTGMVKPIGFWVPPSYLQPFFSRHPAMLQWLYRLEQFFAPSFLSNQADHYFIELIKR